MDMDIQSLAATAGCMLAERTELRVDVNHDHNLALITVTVPGAVSGWVALHERFVEQLERRSVESHRISIAGRAGSTFVLETETGSLEVPAPKRF